MLDLEKTVYIKSTHIHSLPILNYKMIISLQNCLKWQSLFGYVELFENGKKMMKIDKNKFLMVIEWPTGIYKSGFKMQV